MFDYNMMRQFADSWGLLAMAVFFAAVVGMAMRPSARRAHRDAAAIPFKENE